MQHQDMAELGSVHSVSRSLEYQDLCHTANILTVKCTGKPCESLVPCTLPVNITGSTGIQGFPVKKYNREMHFSNYRDPP